MKISLTVLLGVLNILIYYQYSAADCSTRLIVEHVGRIEKLTQFQHPKLKCNFWVTGRIKVRDVLTNQDVKAFITDTTQCFSHNGQPIDCRQLSPIWPVILNREIKILNNGTEKAFAFMVQQIESSH